MSTKMGYEGQLFYGTAGATADQQVENCEDLNYDTDPERGDTTTRGDGTVVPITVSKVCGLKPSLTWKMLNKTDDTIFVALMAAAATGAAVALRTKSYASGKGFDGDVTLSVKRGMPLKGQQTYEFSAEATDDEGRRPELDI